MEVVDNISLAFGIEDDCPACSRKGLLLNVFLKLTSNKIKLGFWPIL